MTEAEAIQHFRRRKQLLKLTPCSLATLLVQSAREHGENSAGMDDTLGDLHVVIDILYRALPSTGVKRGTVLRQLQETFQHIPEYNRILEEPREG